MKKECGTRGLGEGRGKAESIIDAGMLECWDEETKVGRRRTEDGLKNDTGTRGRGEEEGVRDAVTWGRERKRAKVNSQYSIPKVSSQCFSKSKIGDMPSAISLR